MTIIDKYDIMIQNIEKEWYAMNQNVAQAENSSEIPMYSKKQIDRAGQLLSDPDISKVDRSYALQILNNWRSSHAYPLQVIANKLRTDNPEAIVVQRLKRLESIEEKLKRFPSMSLYRMQDLGGCRVIVNSVEDVYRSLNKYKQSRVRHIIKKENDYIKVPKQSGYRGYHAVYQYHSDKTEIYNKNMLIEIQFRTKLQHLWATAVEMMGIYTKTALKSSIGDEDILRFFVLVSSVFAKTEGTPICPNTSENIGELLEEIREIDGRLNIISKLSALSAVIKHINKEKYPTKVGYYILILNHKKFRVSIRHYQSKEFNLASSVYDSIEKQNDPNIDAVLVAAKSFDTVKIAYPNYFVDIREFIHTLKDTMENNKKIRL